MADQGGAVKLRRCPHLDFGDATRLISPEDITWGCKCLDGCPSGENWTCLHCGDTRCSRYVKGHNLVHYQSTHSDAEKSLTVSQAASGMEALGHCHALSHSDLSVWCYACEGYVEHPRLAPLRARMEAAKFGAAPLKQPSSAVVEQGTKGASDSVQEGGMHHPGDEEAMHGRLGKGLGWAPPRVAVVSDQVIRVRAHYERIEASLRRILQDVSTIMMSFFGSLDVFFLDSTTGLPVVLRSRIPRYR